MTDARRAFGWLPNALGIFPENVTLRFFSAGVCGCTLRLRCAARFVLRIIEAGGGIGSYGRNVNQVAQRGMQGAYAGGKAAAAGAGASIGNLGGRIRGALIKG